MIGSMLPEAGTGMKRGTGTKTGTIAPKSVRILISRPDGPDLILQAMILISDYYFVYIR